MSSFFSADRAVISGLLEPFRENSSVGLQRQRSISSWQRKAWVASVSVLSVASIALVFTCTGQTRLGIFVLACGAAGLAAVVVIRRWWHARIARHRREMIDRDLPAFLTTVASSVRAGIDPIRAMCDAESYFSLRSPFVSEIRKFKSSFAEGKDEVVAIEQFLVEEQSVDLLLFKQCLLLSRQLGSSLADPLHRVVRVVRSRQSFRRKTRAALAMHRMSAVGIALCAVLIFGMQIIVDSSRVVMTIQHPAGRVLLSVGVSLIGLGVIWMLRMGREEKV